MSNPYAPPSRDRSDAEAGNDAPGGPARPADPPVGPPTRPLPPPRTRTPPPPPPPPSPEDVARASRRIQHFAALGLASLVTSQLALPWGLAGSVFAVATIVVGVRALLAARRARVGGLAVIAIGAGLGMATFVLLAFTVVVALWPLQLELQRCQHDALTISAKQACLADFTSGLEERRQSLTGDGLPTP